MQTFFRAIPVGTEFFDPYSGEDFVKNSDHSAVHVDSDEMDVFEAEEVIEIG